VNPASRRTRRRHEQQELFRPRGAKGKSKSKSKRKRNRNRAGRKPKGARAGSRHQKRPVVKPQHPLHVVMRVVSAVGNMRRRSLYRAMRDATITAALREQIRIVHISIQRTHVHMLVEAENKVALARGMQGFQISAARNINTALAVGSRRRRGSVFADRYHLEVITSPTRAHHAIRYIVNNWRKHKEDRHGLASTWLVDPFSTGILFPDWKEREDKALMWPMRDTYDPLIVRRPASWLLREGWKRAGSISVHDVPSKRA
jgi:REP element-mobilizing transposase RayT